MAYLLPNAIYCHEAACRWHGRYVVRSGLMHRDKEAYATPENMAPRCLRHAKKLEQWFEAEEARLGVESY